ncbi:YcaO-like family protein [Pseudomonas sp. NPDC089534]|uniref:YcaO-like family protein n=1 Tax=Pseudomonas sp. NPDC089534 TaxID=3364468 RepID=UPI003804D81D
MNKAKVVERELTIAQACRRVEIELGRQGLAPSTRTFGNDLVLVHATLTGPDNRQAHGSGKGYLEHARLGALFEALEHQWAEDHCTADTHTVSADYFADTTLFANDHVHILLNAEQGTHIVCRDYVQHKTRTRFSYPVALISPHYADRPLEQDCTDYRALRRYSSNSGTAIGATYDEALLHATNECIERDAVSLFLLDHFYYENLSPLRHVIRPEQDDALGRLWTDAEREIGAEIVLLDISTEFKARTFLAFSKASGFPVQVFGSGCSLDPRHGAWRALTELVQMHFAAANDEYRNSLLNAQRHLQRFTRLLRCLQFNTEALLQRSPRLSVALPDTGVDSSLTEQIDRLAADLEYHGHVLGVTTLHQTDLGTTVVNVVIPGLERFFTVSSGNVVVPNARGRKLENKPQEFNP